jgi:DNA end-binding protein Ku
LLWRGTEARTAPFQTRAKEAGVAPRAIWKGELRIGTLGFDVALYTAASTSERISLHVLNRKTGNRVHREYVDVDSGKPVEHEDQIKGYEVTRGKYIVLEPEEVAAAVPESDKTIAIETFVPCGEVDDTYFERPYYLTPASEAAQEGFDAVREAMRQGDVAALGRAVLFRRVRTLLIRAHGAGMIATTLHFEDEIRSADEAFAGLKTHRIDDEMLELAQHIIKTKAGRFEPEKFDDRYEEALADLIRAKLAGRKPKAPPKPKATPRNDLMEALRLSAQGAKATAKAKAAAPRRKAS